MATPLFKTELEKALKNVDEIANKTGIYLLPALRSHMAAKMNEKMTRRMNNEPLTHSMIAKSPKTKARKLFTHFRAFWSETSRHFCTG